MLGSSVLDVAIGMVFVFLVISLIVTAGTELIAAWWKWRSDNLWDGVVNLIDQAGQEEWAKKLYEHPLIQGLSSLQMKPPSASTWKKITGVLKYVLTPKTKGPSYIPSRTFAIALLDVIGDKDPSLKLIRREIQSVVDGVPMTASPGEVKALLKDLIAKIPPTANDKIKNDVIEFVGRISDGSDNLTRAKTTLRDIIARVPDTEASLAAFKSASASFLDRQTPDDYAVADLKKDVQDLIGKIPYAGATSEAVKKDLSEMIARTPESGVTVAAVKGDLQNFLNATTNKYIREVISQIDNSHLKKSLLTLMDEADQNVEKLKQDIEIWFNNSMDRVTGWYKRKTQICHLLLAFVFTVLLNADSVLIVKSLMRDPDLRKAVVAQAEKFAAAPPVSIQSPATSNQRQAQSGPQQSNSQASSASPGQAQAGSGTPPPGGSVAPSIVFTPDSVVGGNSLKAVFNLGAAADKEVTVAISGDPDIVSIDPPSKKIESGKQEADFVIKTKPLAVGRSTSINATYDDKTVSTLLTVNETPEEKYRLLRAQLDQLNLPIGWVSQKSDGPLILNPDAIAGGSTVTGYFILDKPAEQDTAPIHLRSDAEKIATVSSEPIVIKKGQQEGTFTVQTVSIDKPKKVTISASVGDAATTYVTTLDIDPVYRSEYRYWPGWYWPWNKGFGNWVGLMGNTVSFHLIGWILTAIAASLGAPFWFDMLNKFITIRSAGKAPEEKPKPPKDVPQPLEPGQTPREADRANR